ncbi:hypothetical protein Cgig2_024164 [Carnegiea gigantea]|uniref:Uncharacterized protein n=1 Tax=Carnegiea gigantea TaxID=171969 RepID=A0A9Q1KB15_9CARY|nr:hypothetical protein Cgig2_024164 [Carnegiea gigantea]
MEDHLDPFSRSTAANESHDQEESLSLRDLPLTPPHSSTAIDPPPTVNHSCRSSASDFYFEFLVNHDDFVTSPADDVIFGGRLLPFAPPPPRRSLSLSSVCRRSDSLLRTESKPQLTQSAIRPSRSLNCRKSSSKAELLPRNSSNSCRGFNSDHYKTAAGLKPPWYWLVLGLPARIPAEMELKDIKSRQIRRSISPAGSFSGDRCSSASWRILSVLSCKSHASVDYTYESKMGLDNSITQGNKKMNA